MERGRQRPGQEVELAVGVRGRFKHPTTRARGDAKIDVDPNYWADQTMDAAIELTSRGSIETVMLRRAWKLVGIAI